MSKSNGFLEVLELVVDKGATDLHLKVPSPPVLRIDGVLMPQEDLPPITPEYIQAIFEQITTQEQRTEFYKDYELDFAYSISGLARFRVNALQQRGTTSLAFHLVPFVIPSIDELGLPRICKELILKPRGLILVTGPAGSGKSTTLAAMINYLNEHERRSIITIEDPIEYLFRDQKCIIRQREVGDDTKSFHAALIRALRHDPDVIVIGEMRDLETMSTAITAAETGHLVLGTLHTIDTAQSIDRIIDIFPPSHQRQIRLQLCQVIEAVLSQTLLPRIGGGRIAAFEIMFATSVIRRLIREEKTFEIPANIEMGRLEGMQTLDQALANLVEEGLVTREDALMKTSNPLKLSELLGPQRETFRLETADEAVALYSEPDKLKARPY
jgi:twitching motility protein PilT